MYMYIHTYVQLQSFIIDYFLYIVYTCIILYNQTHLHTQIISKINLQMSNRYLRVRNVSRL